MKTTPSLRVLSVSLLVFALTGCVSHEALKINAASAAPIIGVRRNEEKIPIRVLGIESSDQTNETKSDLRFLSGDSRGILFPKQARAILSQDLRDYISSRFRIDPTADTILILKLEQAYTYFTFRSSGLNLVPVVGIVSSIADGFQQVPVIFVAELNVEVTADSAVPQKVNVFVRREEKVTGWSATLDAHKVIYLQQLEQVRKTLFDRLDTQLLGLWKDNRFVGTNSHSANNAASLASEFARLDTALADEKISKDEYDALITGVREKYSPR